MSFRWMLFFFFFCQSVNKVILACKFTSFSKNITALLLPPLLQAPSSVFRYVSHTLSTSQVRVVTLGETSLCHLSFVRFCFWKKFQCGLWVRLEYSSSRFPCLFCTPAWNSPYPYPDNLQLKSLLCIWNKLCWPFAMQWNHSFSLHSQKP